MFPEGLHVSVQTLVGPPCSGEDLIGQFSIFKIIKSSIFLMVSFENNTSLKDKNTSNEWVLWKTSHENIKKWWRSMRTESREGRSSLTPFILLPAHFSYRPHPSSLRGEGLNFFACSEKVLYAPQLPRRSSSRVGAVLRDEREGEERGKSERFLFYNVFLVILFGLPLHTVLKNHHSLRENHVLFNTFYYP